VANNKTGSFERPMKIKVLLISSSPHTEKSMTFSLAKDVLKGLSQEGADIETIHLYDFRVFFCKHCEQCHKNILYPKSYR